MDEQNVRSFGAEDQPDNSTALASGNSINDILKAKGIPTEYMHPQPEPTHLDQLEETPLTREEFFQEKIKSIFSSINSIKWVIIQCANYDHYCYNELDITRTLERGVSKEVTPFFLEAMDRLLRRLNDFLVQQFYMRYNLRYVTDDKYNTFMLPEEYLGTPFEEDVKRVCKTLWKVNKNNPGKLNLWRCGEEMNLKSSLERGYYDNIASLIDRGILTRNPIGILDSFSAFSEKLYRFLQEDGSILYKYDTEMYRKHIYSLDTIDACDLSKLNTPTACGIKESICNNQITSISLYDLRKYLKEGRLSHASSYFNTCFARVAPYVYLVISESLSSSYETRIELLCVNPKRPKIEIEDADDMADDDNMTEEEKQEKLERLEKLKKDTLIANASRLDAYSVYAGFYTGEDKIKCLQKVNPTSLGVESSNLKVNIIDTLEEQLQGQSSSLLLPIDCYFYSALPTEYHNLFHSPTANILKQIWEEASPEQRKDMATPYCYSGEEAVQAYKSGVLDKPKKLAKPILSQKLYDTPEYTRYKLLQDIGDKLTKEGYICLLDKQVVDCIALTAAEYKEFKARISPAYSVTLLRRGTVEGVKINHYLISRQPLSEDILDDIEDGSLDITTYHNLLSYPTRYTVPAVLNKKAYSINFGCLEIPVLKQDLKGAFLECISKYYDAIAPWYEGLAFYVEGSRVEIPGIPVLIKTNKGEVIKAVHIEMTDFEISCTPYPGTEGEPKSLDELLNLPK